MFKKFFSSQFPFNKEQVRILLFRECDWRGRRLLFDSSAIEPVTTTSIPNNSQQTQQGQNSCGTPLKPCAPPKNSNIEYCDGKQYKVSFILRDKKL